MSIHAMQLPSQIGLATAIAHHGELLQGVFPCEDGRLRRGLITLPFSDLYSAARFEPRGSPGVTTHPSLSTKATNAALLTLNYLKRSDIGGDLWIESAIPIGHGYGSSTADVVATIKATARSLGWNLARATVSRLAVQAEQASDAIVYGSQPVLFAHREGAVVEYLPGDFPSMIVVGGQSPGGPVDTDGLARARYSVHEIQQFSFLRSLAAVAMRGRDAKLLCRVASASATISQAHLPKVAFEDVKSIAVRYAADGVQVAHSGSLIGILFDAGSKDVEQRSLDVLDELTALGLTRTTRFFTSGGGDQ